MAFHISSLLATLLFVALATEPLGYEVWSMYKYEVGKKKQSWNNK